MCRPTKFFDSFPMKTLHENSRVSVKLTQSAASCCLVTSLTITEGSVSFETIKRTFAPIIASVAGGNFMARGVLVAEPHSHTEALFSRRAPFFAPLAFET